MYEPKENQEEQNFWVSYADLMAGLLFVFILVIGAIVIKFVYVQNTLESTKTTLEKEHEALKLSNQALEEKKNAYKRITEKLNKAKVESVHLSFELAIAQNKYLKLKKDLKESKSINELLNLDLKNKDTKLLLTTTQIVKITKILNDKKNNIELLDMTIAEQRKIIEKHKISLAYRQTELVKLKDLLLGYELKDAQNTDVIQTLRVDIDKNTNIIRLRDSELDLLTNTILSLTKEHQKLVEEFDIAKVKIKSLTGIRIKVITALKKKLGNSINIDPNSGAIKLSSNILFDQGQFELKQSSAGQLSTILKKYIHVLLLDKDIRKHIDTIIIQGHSNSDGSYLYNLQLSQQRALEVMKFLYVVDNKNKDLLENYITASGRSYSDIILLNGKEDKDASRRIEIKFRIKNEDAIKQLSNYLNR